MNHPGHAEAVEIVFDPGRISYRGLLEFFFQIHRPDLGERLVGSDYRSEIFCTSDEQRQVAEGTIADADASGLWPGKVVTEISEAGPLWEAEAEDQDYLQRYQHGYTFSRDPGWKLPTARPRANSAGRTAFTLWRARRRAGPSASAQRRPPARFT